MTDAIDHLARLAGIDLDPDEREQLVRHLAELQRLIDALPEATPDPSDAQTVDLTLRPDDPGAPLDPETVLGIMPRRRGPWLDLPRVGEGES